MSDAAKKSPLPQGIRCHLKITTHIRPLRGVFVGSLKCLTRSGAGSAERPALRFQIPAQIVEKPSRGVLERSYPSRRGILWITEIRLEFREERLVLDELEEE